MMDAGYWMLDAGYWMLFIVLCSVLTDQYSLFIQYVFACIFPEGIFIDKSVNLMLSRKP